METKDLFSKRACYHCNASCRKLKRIKDVEKLEIYKFASVHFWYMIHAGLARKVLSPNRRHQREMNSTRLLAPGGQNPEHKGLSQPYIWGTHKYSHTEYK